MGVMITDKETPTAGGDGDLAGTRSRTAGSRNEVYFLQAIGDQMLMSVSHTRLRSLVRRMAFRRAERITEQEFVLELFL